MIAGKKQGFLMIFFPFNQILLFLQMHETANDFQPTVHTENVLPEIGRTIGCVVFGRRITSTVVMSFIKWKKARVTAFKPGGEIDFIRIKSKVNQRSFFKLEQKFFRVATGTILLHTILNPLAGEVVF